MRDYMKEYLDLIVEKLEKIRVNQKAAIEKAARMMAEKIKEDGVIYIFGSGGHSNMMAEEMFHRAGGLACISPVFADSIRIPHVPLGERSPGLAKYIMDFYDINKGDLLLLVNGYGINPVTIETAIECQKREVEVVAITSTDYAEKLPRDFHGRHKTGQNLHEMFDTVILTHMDYGDALLQMDGIDSLVGSYSTFGNAYICNSLVIETCRILVEEDIEPPIINSINVVGGQDKNQKLYKKYRGRIRWL
jgi:uncharacterized phosphosugar-binding protein